MFFFLKNMCFSLVKFMYAKNMTVNIMLRSIGAKHDWKKMQTKSTHLYLRSWSIYPFNGNLQPQSLFIFLYIYLS